VRLRTLVLTQGVTRTVAIRLPRSKLKALVKKRQQQLTVTARAHDPYGTTRTSTRKLTLIAPH
jgi:hypothetical protein